MAEDQDDLDIGKLNEMYSRAESADSDIFNEMRTNLLMVSGKHYAKTSKRIQRRIEGSGVDEATKIRLVQNRIWRNTNIYKNHLIKACPGVRPKPHAESEIQDRKAAEIANSVWQDAKHRYSLRAQDQELINHLVDIGEMCEVIFWDPNKGELVGYEQEMSEGGQPLYHSPLGEKTTEPHTIDQASGQAIPHEPVKSNKPIYSGDFVFEVVPAYNLKRDPAADTMDRSQWFMIDKMMSKSEAKLLCGGDEELLKAVESSSATQYRIFDATKSDYVDSKDQVLIKQFIHRPCYKHPNGRLILFVESKIIHDMELPYGVFHLNWAGFQKLPGSPRAHSIIRVGRPMQADINRLVSMSAENSIAFGSDRLLIQKGSGVEKGGELGGTRIMRYTGERPEILPGRPGEQFVEAIQARISAMDDAMMVNGLDEEINGQLDPYSLLYRSARQKNRYAIYAEIVQEFMKRRVNIFFKLAKEYLPEDRMIQIVGRKEYVNIAEFKGVSDLSYSIELEEVSDDIESTLGKALMQQQILQYTGKDLPPEAVVEIISQMPWIDQSSVSDLMADKKNADNDILAMDRGIYVAARKGENHKYIIKRLDRRMKDRDFDLLSPQIKEAYEKKRHEHEELISVEMAEMTALKSQLIPTGGALVTVDLYVNVPGQDGQQKPMRWRAPYEALQWLHQTLETQRMAQMDYENIEPNTMGEIGRMMPQQNPQMSNSGAGQMQNQPTQGLGDLHGSQSDFGQQQLPGNNFN